MTFERNVPFWKFHSKFFSIPFIPSVHNFLIPPKTFPIPHNDDTSKANHVLWEIQGNIGARKIIKSNGTIMKLLWGPEEHLRCRWSGSHWALHQDSCNDFTNPLYSGSNHSRGRSHAAGNCFTVTGTDQRPPIIKGDDGPKRDIDTTSLQIIAATWHRSQNSVAMHLDRTTNVLNFVTS